MISDKGLPLAGLGAAGGHRLKGFEAAVIFLMPYSSKMLRTVANVPPLKPHPLALKSCKPSHPNEGITKCLLELVQRAYYLPSTSAEVPSDSVHYGKSHKI